MLRSVCRDNRKQWDNGLQDASWALSSIMKSYYSTRADGGVLVGRRAASKKRLIEKPLEIGELHHEIILFYTTRIEEPMEEYSWGGEPHQKGIIMSFNFKKNLKKFITTAQRAVHNTRGSGFNGRGGGDRDDVSSSGGDCGALVVMTTMVVGCG
ncbi:hypothetical protein OSB04_009629 [Centaurea solstitialis]|uniref:Uncharacterized protein n=1 Tax=Centaurea solstitialis TaxID=347529 RepID=A0AA38T5Z7_9ASTR|nr:hypothetical protein OSB04_009629 [Centaurea solstitialis]